MSEINLPKTISVKKLSIIIAVILLITFPSRIIYAEDEYTYNYAALTGKCEVYDPLESFNRKIFFFNGMLDTILLRPIAKGYGGLTNDYTKERVGSFVYNIEEPLSTVNYMLQNKPEGMYKSFWRFVINSTIGIGGLFDVASKFDVNAEQQAFSNTLGHYGVGPGPYIILPIFGGSGMRELTDGLATNRFLNPLKYKTHKSFMSAVKVTRIVHSRNSIMPFTDYTAENSSDPYITIRNAILQQRESKMDYPEGFRCPRFE